MPLLKDKSYLKSSLNKIPIYSENGKCSSLHYFPINSAFDYFPHYNSGHEL